MNKKSLTTLLSGIIAGTMGYFGAAMADDVPAAKSPAIAAPAENITPITASETAPQKKVPIYGSIKQRLEQAFKESGECDKVYWVNFSEEDVLVCDKEDDGERRQKYGVNLAQICDVRLQENYRWYVFEWLGGDDVIVSNTSGDVYTLRFWDRSAADIYHILSEHIDKNVPKSERCSESGHRKESRAEGFNLIRVNN